MRVIIVDDEQLARGVLREYLGTHADIEIVGECANGFEAVKAIAELAPDLVFLDIQMAKLNGFEVLELAGRAARTIFVTACEQYAIKAFEVHAVDYLLKPFSQQRLDVALAHARVSPAPAGADPGRRQGTCDRGRRYRRDRGAGRLRAGQRGRQGVAEKPAAGGAGGATRWRALRADPPVLHRQYRAHEPD